MFSAPVVKLKNNKTKERQPLGKVKRFWVKRFLLMLVGSTPLMQLSRVLRIDDGRGTKCCFVREICLNRFLSPQNKRNTSHAFFNLFISFTTWSLASECPTDVVKPSSPPGPAAAVAFASFSSGAAVSLGGVQPLLCHFLLNGLERLVDCRLQAAREKQKQTKQKERFKCALVPPREKAFFKLSTRLAIPSHNKARTS